MPSPDKLKVLLVDDSEATNTLITALLQRDYSIDIATDGVEAIEKLKTGNYAAVLLDLRMPHKDGFEVLEFVGNDVEALKRVIIVTASLTPKDLDRVRKYSVFSIVAKPFEVEHLLNTVHACTGRRGGNTLGNVFSAGTMLLIAQILRHRMM